LLIGAGMVAACAAANLRPPRSVGRSALFMTIALLVPFAVLTVLAGIRPAAADSVPEPPRELDYVSALLFALWNYMGWDNATTIAGEVDRPQRTYPLAMAGAVMLVTLTYVLPVLAASRSGIAPEDWKTGWWVKVADHVGSPALAIAIAVGGMIMAFGTFNALVLSYSRIPAVLAEDGYLPAVFTRRLGSGAPWVAIVTLAVAWALATQLGLKRVLALDVVLYGLSLLLEFAALVALRIREPRLDRPFRVPGGIVVAMLLAVFPALLIGLAIFDQAGKWATDEPDDLLAPATALLLGAGLAALGPVCYVASRWLNPRVPANQLQ
jgi:amino acid transporter